MPAVRQVLMEQLTRDEIEMCQIAVSHVAEYKLNNNKEKWNTLWDKLERMQRDCLTQRVPDVCPECAGSGKTGSIGLPRECPYCDGTGKRR